VFIGVNAKDFRADARRFVRRYRVTYPNVYDGKGSTLGRYGVTAFPETYFLDAQGRVVYRIAGAVRDRAELEGGIERALAGA
jgi:cytochrome c biogenesis protein CcmG/thiol:disulfide interchange protein DsbE